MKFYHLRLTDEPDSQYFMDESIPSLLGVLAKFSSAKNWVNSDVWDSLKLKVVCTDSPSSIYIRDYYRSVEDMALIDKLTNPNDIIFESELDVTTDILRHFRHHLQGEDHNRTAPHGRKVFIAHGRNKTILYELIFLLESEFGLRPVVMEESASVTLTTLLSKFEELAQSCVMLIVLFTPDDRVSDGVSNVARVRQNILLELGYFLGMWHNQNIRQILILHQLKVEIPSNISGVEYISFDESVKEVFLQMKRQFKKWGI